ncbi:PKHL1 protein, partial [Polypterus senegalus]|nr:PKHL1 protein [Polypterus senegalus]
MRPGERLRVLLCLASLSSAAADFQVRRVYQITPTGGGTNGAVKVTISGRGFAQANQFNYGPGNENLGNSVLMVSNTRTVPCDVEKQESYSTQITCYTRSMPEDNYVVKVSVDGEPIPDINTIWFHSRGYQTPVIQSVTPVTGLPGTLITIRGMIFTDAYGSSTQASSNGNSARISRVYIGGMPCDLLYPNSDRRYGISLDYQWSQLGTMTCRITGTYVGHQNVSFTVDGPYGRSLPDVSTYFVSSANKLAMFQTYAVVTSISPSAGGSEGGTILTIKGQYFDQTDAPARVLVGGQNCPVLSVSDSQITCRSPAQPDGNRTVFAGGRGLKLEVWNKTAPQKLEDIMAYNESTPGYYTTWLDSSSYSFPYNSDNFASRLSGFYVPAVTDDYRFYVSGVYKAALYLSQTGLPNDKVQIMSSPNWWSTLVSTDIHLEKGKEYYFEIILQKMNYYYADTLRVQLFQKKSSFTQQQTGEAQNEVQVLNTVYNFLNEVQDLCLNNWTTQTPIQEVQQIVVESPCVSSGDCTAMQFSLLYNNEATEPIAVGASSDEVKMALNALPSFQNDTVSVMKTESTNGPIYTVTFNSDRGDFDVLQYDTAGNDINIEISEITKGRPKFDTFTLMWNGVSSSPLSVNATPDEVVRKGIYDMAGTRCPRSLNGYAEGGSVKYFQDFETYYYWSWYYSRVSDREAFCGHFSALNPSPLFNQNQVRSTWDQYGEISLSTHNMLCFAYKGFLNSSIGLSFSVVEKQQTNSYQNQFEVGIVQADEWQYICIDMLRLLKASYPGTDYKVQQITLNRLSPTQDYLIDTIYIGSDYTVTNMQDLNLRRSALAGRGIFLQDLSVIQKQGRRTSESCYRVTLMPMNCGYDFPLMEIRFAQNISGDGENETVYQGSNWNKLTTFRVTRVQAASPPIMGSFDVSIYGQEIKNLPVNISAADLKYALVGIPGMGQVDVLKWGDCRGYVWKVTWLSVPGKQPTLQINSSSVIGKNAYLNASTERDGGLFKQSVLGDFYRVPQRKPQVQVYINNIISMCSGDCSYQWDPLKTPVISGISPTKDTQITCRIGNTTSGSAPVTVYVPGVGFAKNTFNFTILPGGSFTFAPPSGSTAGGTVLTISGYGFSRDPTVRISDKLCPILSVNLDRLQCTTPANKAGSYNVTVTVEGVDITLGVLFTYDTAVTASITQISPASTFATERTNLTISGSNFQTWDPQSSVSIDNAECSIMKWTDSEIICLLPVLRPGMHNIQVKVKNWGFASASSHAVTTIEYVLQVTSVRPLMGSLYGGTKLTLTGSGFGTNPDDIQVLLGQRRCNVTDAARDRLECVVQAPGKMYTVTNLGSDIARGVGYAWTPSSLKVFVGDKVQWQWQAQSLIGGIAYRVFSVTNPSDTTFSGQGFNSGPSRTPSGYFTYEFTIPGVYYYSSGYIDNAQTIAMQGVVTVNPLPDDQENIFISVLEIEANYKPRNVQLSVNGIPAACYSDCRFHYTDSSLPQVDSVSPDTVDSSSTVLSINGTGFGSDPDNVLILIGDFTFHPSQVTETEITCPIGPLPAGSYILNVVVMSKGLASGNIAISSLATATLSPNSGSILGGTTLLITGNGFYPGYTTVTVGGIPCAITNITTSEVKCTTAANNQGNAAVNIQVLSTVYPPLYFMYSVDSTPVISSVDPSTGSSGTAISISGSGFGSVADDIVVTIGGSPCALLEVNDTAVQCTLGSHSGGSFAITLLHVMKGYATSSVSFGYKLDLKSVTPSQGSFGGGAILQLTGDGFDEQLSAVFVCDSSCVVDALRSSSTTLYCEVPLSNGTGSSQGCDLTVYNGKNLVTLSNAFTYESSLTPVVTAVTPRRGGTGGGTKLTITGSGFGTPCNVAYVNETEIICITDARPQSQRAKVKVNIGGNGIAKLDNADFFYIDVWSSPYTWGGESPPDDGSFVVITPGQTILLDTSTAILKMLLIQGGTLVFDEVDLELNAENILIVDGGTLQVGTEQAPFQHKAIITLHGHLRSPELPLYGAKTLAVREGTLDLHGTPVPFTWTRLAKTADAGSTTVQLQNPVTWKAGDEIVIASTGDRLSQNQNELMVIESISSDGATVNLTNPLKYRHLGLSVRTPDGQHFEARAEVGLLTRNVVIRGSDNVEWKDTIPACPEGFDPGEFAVQTCFQGRYGDQVGSDQFGGCIMFSTPLPNQNSAIGRIEYVEVFHAGQAFRLGRYPINWHFMGDLKFTSYVRGCSIHQTYNRAVAMYKTSNLLVERNVIYDIMGGALIFEDGSETGNVLQYNLAVFVMQSTSLLNDDITPAAFWISNPNNTIRHNAVAGGSHIGFWYRLQDSITGELHDANICEKNEILGQFYNNSVHSQGWYGLWIFEQYYPMQQGYCNWYNPQPAVFDSLTTWNCLKGAEWLNAGALQFKNFLMVNNELSGIEMKRLQTNYVRGWGEAGGAMIINSTVIGHLDELGLLPGNCTQRGIVLPLDDGLTVAGIKFINFDRSSCAAMGFSSCSYTNCGGWRVKFSGVQYFNTTNKAGFTWEHEVALMDTDGSLSGHANNTVIPYSALLDPSHCRLQVPEWSAGYNGSVCDSTVSFHRLTFWTYWYLSMSVLLSDSFGISIVYGLALIPDGQTFNWTFQNFPILGPTNTLLYRATFSGFKESSFVIIRHQCAQNYEGYNIVDNRRGLSQPLNQSSMNGDWYFDNNTSTVEYIISGNTSQGYWYSSSLDPLEKNTDVNFRIYHCYFTSCYSGGGGGGVVTTTTAQPPRTSGITLWSNTTFWLTSAENKYAVPVDGSSVVIPRGWLVVIDVEIPRLSQLSVYGTLEVPSNMSKYAMWAPNATLAADNNNRTVIIRTTYLYIQGGTLLVGQPDEPFQGELQIIFRGNMLTPDWHLPAGFNLGAKVLGVFGTLDLHGKPHSIYRTKLAMSADAGSSSISLANAVDWQVGDDILITTTSYDPWQAETRKIVGISKDMKTLILNDSLSYAHIAETYYINETNQQYTLAADVGLLSRNIKIISEDYPGWYQESYGARVLVRSGAARLSNVEFYHTGQNGYVSDSDPRYSVVFMNMEEISENITSYIQGCSFHHGFSPAIGIFGTNKLSVDDNIIYFTVGQGIHDLGTANKIRRNLVALTVWPGSFRGKQPATYTLWHAAIEINQGADTVLQDNIVSGFERSGYRINGEPCPGTFNPAETWRNNEAHGGLYGVYLNEDGLPDCTFIQGFTVWKCWDYGIYFQTSMSVQISNVTLVDNGMGIMPMSYTSPAMSHQYSSKIKNSLFVGSSPDFNCSDVLTTSNINIQYTPGQRSPRPLQGGRSAVGWPTFASQHNGAPATPHAGLTSYTAISGLVAIRDSTFAGFRNVCSGQINVMFITNPNNEDLQHPIHVMGIQVISSTENAFAFIHRPDLSLVNPSKCVDMTCDAKRKTLLKDLDGSLLGQTGTVVPQSEYQWAGDTRYGLGDYRIPKVMLTYLNGSRIPVTEIAPNKGVIRDPSCTYMPSWQSYKCFTLDYEMLVIESLDSDTETRRLSPVAVLADGYLDLLNGPADHSWCKGYSCRRRLSMFHTIVAANKSFSTVRVAIFYSNPQRLDVYTNDLLVAPTNAVWNSDHSDYTLSSPTYPDQFVPQMNSTISGSNYFDSDYKMLNILVRGSTPIVVRTSPLLFISFNMPFMTVDEFFGPNLIKNLAAFLKIPATKIRITKIVRASSRRKREAGMNVEVQIAEPPSQQATQTPAAGQLQVQDLVKIADTVGQVAIAGNLSAAVGYNVTSVGIEKPQPIPSDPGWAEMASTPVTTRDNSTTSYVSTVTSLVIVKEPIVGQQGGLLIQQPSIMAVDQKGACVSVGVTSIVLTATLKGQSGQGITGLEGNTTIPFSNCWANYTDLSLTVKGRTECDNGLHDEQHQVDVQIPLNRCCDTFGNQQHHNEHHDQHSAERLQLAIEQLQPAVETLARVHRCSSGSAPLPVVQRINGLADLRKTYRYHFICALFYTFLLPA